MFRRSRRPLAVSLSFFAISSFCFAQGPAVVDSDLVNGINGVRFLGFAAGERAGIGVSLAGDLNGDGFDDLAVGADFASLGGFVYVVFGEPAIGVPELSLPAAAELPNGFWVVGAADEFIGLHVAGGGDFNADGFDDLIAIGGNVQTQNDRAYIIYGDVAPDHVLLAGLTGERGLIFQTPGSLFVDNLDGAFAGDLNGDGFDDVVIGAPRANNLDGAVHVLFGRPAGAAGQPDLIEDTDLDGANGFTILGTSQSTLGDGVGGGDDVNGDGLDDLVAGAPTAENGSQVETGTALLVFGSSLLGSPGAPAVVQLPDLANGEDGILFEGEGAFDYAGQAVALSDLNDDGLADVAIGTPLRNAAGSDAGAVYVRYGDASWGSPGTPAVIPLDSVDETSGVTLVGETLYLLGSVLASSDDLNGDGIEDLVVGAANSGQASVLLGSASLGTVGSPATLAVADLSGTTGYAVLGETSSSFGSSVSAGDFDGNGLDDVLIGSFAAPPAGEAVLVYGDLDDDLDGVPDGFDNCLEISNPAQRDTNGDTFGNRCDADLDNDNIVNFADLELMSLAFFNQGPDLDEDLNGDGIVNFADLAIMKALFFLPPGPSGLLP